jgi:hypothetical protein
MTHDRRLVTHNSRLATPHREGLASHESFGRQSPVISHQCPASDHSRQTSPVVVCLSMNAWMRALRDCSDDAIDDLSTIGSMRRQGGHQVAEKSTRTSPLDLFNLLLKRDVRHDRRIGKHVTLEW